MVSIVLSIIYIHVSIHYYSVFEGNKCPAGGVVSTYHNSVRFTEVTTFASNTGSALRVWLHVLWRMGAG